MTVFVIYLMALRKNENRKNEGRRQRDMNSLETRYVRNATFAVGVLFQSKWRLQILCAMRSGPVRLGQLARLIPGASKKMLTENLRQSEADGIAVRKDISDLVLHIEYEVGDSTREGVCSLLDHLAEWADFILVNREMRKNSHTNPARRLSQASGSAQRDTGKGAGGGTRLLRNSSKQAVKERLTICLTDRLIDHGWKSNEFRNSALRAHFR
jgi:DNA-binding HxlR family transcriptional regulator